MASSRCDFGNVVSRYSVGGLTRSCAGRISAVTFFAKTRKNVAIKNLLGEPGDRH